MRIHARGSPSVTRSDCADESATAETSAVTDEFDFEMLRGDEVSFETVIATFGLSQRCARRQAPLVKMWWSRFSCRDFPLSLLATETCCRLRSLGR